MLAGAAEQLVSLPARLLRRFELAHPPGQEGGQAELHHRPAAVIGGTLEQAVDRTQGLDGDRGIGLGPVVDEPLGARVHRLQHLEPALVIRGQEVDELRLQLERLAVRLASLGLAHGVEQHFNRLRIPPHGGTGEMQRGLRQPSRPQQRARRLPVQQPAPRTAGRLVDDVADQRVLHDVAELAAPLLLDHDPRVHQLGQVGRDLLERSPGQHGHIAQRHRPPDDSQQLEHALRVRVEPAQFRGDPLRETLGQATQVRREKVTLLLEKRPEQSDREQRIAAGALADPIDEHARRRLLDHRLGQLPQRRLGQRAHFHAGEQRILVELEQHRSGDGVTRQFCRPARRDHQQPRVVEVPREETERLPGRRVREVDVIEQYHERSPLQDLPEQAREALQQPGERGIPVGDRAADQGNAMKQASEVVEQSAAQIDHLLVGQRLEERLDGLGPQAEGGTRRERVALGHETPHFTVAPQQLAPQAALAHPGVANQQNQTEVPIYRPAQFVLERLELFSAPHELESGARRRPARAGRGANHCAHDVSPGRFVR